MMTSPLLALVFLVAAAISLVELVRARVGARIESYIADREAHMVHVVMNGAMAVMLAPFYGAGPERVMIAVLAAGVAVLGVRIAILLRRGGMGNRIAGSAYHLLGLAAMLYAIRTMPAAMHGMAMAPSTAAWLLAALFLLDGLATAVLAGLFPRLLLRMEGTLGGDSLRGRSLRAIRLAAIPHCVMDVGMVLMLVG